MQTVLVVGLNTVEFRWCKVVSVECSRCRLYQISI